MNAAGEAWRFFVKQHESDTGVLTAESLRSSIRSEAKLSVTFLPDDAVPALFDVLHGQQEGRIVTMQHVLAWVQAAMETSGPAENPQPKSTRATEVSMKRPPADPRQAREKEYLDSQRHREKQGGAKSVRRKQ